MTTELVLKLSAIIDKMGIAKELVTIDKASNEEVGKEIVALLISNLHKAADEVYDFIANYKGITTEEAKKVNVIDLFKELTSTEGIKDFLS